MGAVAAWISVVLDTIQNIFVAGEIGLFIWLFQGGWMWSIRKVDFLIDCKLVNFIASAYEYFTKFLNPDGLAENNLFNPYITGQIVNNIYVFIGVIVFFRLMMVVIKYLLNPDLVADAKIGVNSLIQRCIIGMCGILFIPTLFDLAMDLQVAILKDQIIQQIIVPKEVLNMVQEEMESGGKYIGTYVLSGFVSPKSSAPKKVKNEYKVAVDKGDLSAIDINKGGWMADSESYEYEYFFIASTFVLCYVFYQIMKYTIDLAVRSFKMLLFQILAPIAMVEYMISGSDDGVFKSWRTAVLSTYLMVFTRVMAIWFVVFITILMSGKPELADYTSNSLLGQAYKSPLTGEPDYLLRAIIIIALLGFMMDLPKIIGQVFGLDLEQESSATGVLKQVGGLVKGAALGGLAVTGAAVGSAVGGLGKVSAAGRQGKMDAKAQGLKGKDMRKQARLNAKGNLGKLGVRAGIGAGIGGMVSAAMGSNQFTGAFANSYSGNKQKQDQIPENEKARSEAKAKQEARETARDENLAKIVKSQGEQTKNQEFAAAMKIATRLEDSELALTPKELAVRLKPEAFDHTSSMVANISGVISGKALSSVSETDISNGKVTGESRTRVVQEVEQVLTTQCAQSGISVPKEQIKIQAEYIVDNTTFNPPATPDDRVSATVDVNMITTATGNLASQDQTITQVINQVQGTKVSPSSSEGSETITRTVDYVVNDSGMPPTSSTSYTDDYTINYDVNVDYVVNDSGMPPTSPTSYTDDYAINYDFNVDTKITKNTSPIEEARSAGEQAARDSIDKNENKN